MISTVLATETSLKNSSRAVAGWVYCLLAAAIVVIGVAIYSPVFFNAFVADDFMHVSWLHQAAQQPELLLRNFHTPWLDVQSARFYRPLISITLFCDYMLWHDNATGYHVSNAVFNGLTGMFMFLFLCDFTAKMIPNMDAAKRIAYAASAAFLFVSYPLHTEAISWITARVDAVMAVFFTASLWCYLRWRLTDNRIYLGSSLLAMLLSLCSKEMSFALPPTVVALEFICLSADYPPVERIRITITKTLAFWLAFALYLVVRANALGTLIGGYDDRLGLSMPLDLQIKSWSQGIKMLILPLNAELISDKTWSALLWKSAIGACSLALAATLFSKPWRRLALFFLCFAALALAPVYKLFSISPNLEASRFAYLVSVPLCALLPLGLWNMVCAARLSFVRALAVLAILGLSLSSVDLLLRNNRAWVKAGREANAVAQTAPFIIAEAQKHPCLLFGVPDSIHGAYVTRGAFMGMFGGAKYPILSVADNEPVSILKQQLLSENGAVSCFWWDRKKARFVAGNLDRTPAEQRLDTIRSVKGVTIGSTIKVSPFAGEMQLRMPEPAAYADFLLAKLQPVSTEPAHRYLGFRYSNALQRDIELWEPIVVDKHGNAAALFNLHQHADWFLGGRPADLRLLLPANAEYISHGIEFAKTDELAPTLTISGLTLGGIAEIHAGVPAPCVVSARCMLPECKKLRLTVLKPLSSFEFENRPSSDSNSVLFTKELTGNSGTFSLTWNDFRGPAFHRARIEALDADGNLVGLPSDSILFHTLAR